MIDEMSKDTSIEDGVEIGIENGCVASHGRTLWESRVLRPATDCVALNAGRFPSGEEIGKEAG